ncbi:hypothetical protein E4K73_48305 [Streptomyces sp. IB201691-2A2]|nr:hypothetical protein E4K73_48305 [Streptomyces sp. IB201691-2A2]
MRGALQSTPPGQAAPEQNRHELVSWVNSHGGAGATTMAAVLGGLDAGRRWPDLSRGEPGRIVLLARTHAAGLRAASRALDRLRSGKHPAGVELLALALVTDAPGRLPMQLFRRVRVLRSAVPTVTIPWNSAWRVGDLTGRMPRQIEDLNALIAPGSAAQKVRK